MSTPTTKRFPVALGRTGAPTARSEFIIPPLTDDVRDSFVGLKSGRRHGKGAISFIGKAISSKDVLAKLATVPSDAIAAEQVIDEFIQRLAEFKVGNIIAIQHQEDGGFVLRKVADRLASATRPKLP